MSYISLYDYLGRAAGLKLGEEVKNYAAQNGVPFKTKEISTPKYQGKVNIYPKDFLDLYFREPEDYRNQEEIKDDLPF